MAQIDSFLESEPEGEYTNWVSSAEALSEGWNGKIFITRIRHSNPMGKDDEPERAQGGLRLILPKMLGKPFEDALEQLHRTSFAV